MGHDHRKKKNETNAEDAGPSSSSGSGDSTGDEIQQEKQRAWEEEQERKDTVSTLPDQFGGPLKRHHTKTLGMLKFRADDDDEPSDWWFASTAIPLIAATFAPMANVLSIAALVVYWRNKLTQPSSNPEYMETSVGLEDPKWYATHFPFGKNRAQ